MTNINSKTKPRHQRLARNTKHQSNQQSSLQYQKTRTVLVSDETSMAHFCVKTEDGQNLNITLEAPSSVMKRGQAIPINGVVWRIVERIGKGHPGNYSADFEMVVVRNGWVTLQGLQYLRN